jgi:hypothetical protein
VVVLAGALALAAGPPASAQSFEVLGTRASGMGGAFVAVADDATAVYWNPAGLVLGGSYFGLIVDSSRGQSQPDDSGLAGRRSANIIAVSTPPLGLSYYRLDATTLTPDPPGEPTVRLQQLVTHHTGVTFVQSLTSHLAISSTLKWVHGVTATGLVPSGDRDDVLDEADDLPDTSTNRFDADIGVMASFGTVRAGLTVRNASEPEFDTLDGDPIELKRQTRAGIAYVGVPSLIVAADIDIERSVGSLGEVRNLAAGAEARLWPRASFRTGFRFNTLSDQPGGRAHAYSLGASVVTYRSFVVDAHVTLGSEAADRGWGIAGRLSY